MWDELRARPHLALSALVFVGGVLLWEAIVRVFRVPSFLAPSPPRWPAASAPTSTSSTSG